MKANAEGALRRLESDAWQSEIAAARPSLSLARGSGLRVTEAPAGAACQ